MKRLLCKIGIHLGKGIIGTAVFPFDSTKKILVFGCKICGNKLLDGVIVDKSKYEAQK